MRGHPPRHAEPPTQIDFDPANEVRNRRKHGLDFSFASLIFADPLATTIYGRFQDGEHRWHTFGRIAGKLLLVVHVSGPRPPGLRPADRSARGDRPGKEAL